jgi:hypothetical protein
MPAPVPFTEPDARREWLRDQLRRKRVLPDGERISFATISDQAPGFRTHFSDGTPDLTFPHAPGFRFSDVDDSAKLAADRAYIERRTSMDYRYRVDARPDADRGSQQPTLLLDELEQAAVTAYEERSERLRTAWRRP